MFVYLMVLKCYPDNTYNEEPLCDIEIFETESMAYNWVKKFFLNTALTLLIDDIDEQKKIKKNAEKMTCDEIRDEYLIGTYHNYKYNYSIEKKWVFTADLEKYLKTNQI